MRLIDADKLEKELFNTPLWDNEDEDEFYELINKQPTAYDIDKVVRQFWKTSDCYRKSRGFCDDTNCVECRHCHLTLKQAIELVKGACDGQSIT